MIPISLFSMLCLVRSRKGYASEIVTVTRDSSPEIDPPYTAKQKQTFNKAPSETRFRSFPVAKIISFY